MDWSLQSVRSRFTGVADTDHELSDPNAPRSLAAFQRRAGLSHWLQVKLVCAPLLAGTVAACDVMTTLFLSHDCFRFATPPMLTSVHLVCRTLHRCT